MDTTWTLDETLYNHREDPEDNDPKGGGFDELGTGKSGKKTDSDSGDDQATG